MFCFFKNIKVTAVYLEELQVIVKMKNHENTQFYFLIKIVLLPVLKYKDFHLEKFYFLRSSRSVPIFPENFKTNTQKIEGKLKVTRCQVPFGVFGHVKKFLLWLCLKWLKIDCFKKNKNNNQEKTKRGNY